MNNDLQGKFHAHITLLTDDESFACPKGWKTTIIILKRGERVQKDIMITRHYYTGTTKTGDAESILAHVKQSAQDLKDAGFNVIRVKLEHESLPTVSPNEHTYRECHVKIRKQVHAPVSSARGFVQSLNPMEVRDDTEVVFLNARFYEGTVEDVDTRIDQAVDWMKRINLLNGTPIEVLEVKKESTVFDSNLALDKWWA